ncbi:hypothetical protein BJV78DRAFT_1131681 [Lactifluus subvellereus]|nr:hypothetical protein BJV78DRAFT_1131681 [Lactifluus subvellereus]
MTRKPRTLVLCFDGTADEYGPRNTNVVKLYSLLKKDKVEDQLCYYQAGIGTYIQPGVVSPLFRWAAQTLDKAFAWYLYEHVMEGYRFLMQNYNVHDKVCIFGFSRGAYTARALAGMLHKVGLLSKDNTEQVPFAYKLYKSGDDTVAQGFKATFCRDVPIDFVGVWDTVASVGVVSGRTLPFVDVNTTIRVFRQALSLDERRVRFRPNLYHRSVPDQPAPKDGTDPAPDALRTGTDELYKTDMKEVWFAGCHSDVGGGAALDSAAHALANIPLRWMIEQIVGADCPILLDLSVFARWNIPVAIVQQGYSSRSQGRSAPKSGERDGDGDGDGDGADSDQQDAQDVVQPVDDELRANPAWWILEILPMSYAFQDAQDKWTTRWSVNLGRGRSLPQNPSFHESVRIRMGDAKLKYKPRARYTRGTETYVS